MWYVSLLLTAVLNLFAAPGGDIAPIRMEAKFWWNYPAVQRPDDRTIVVLFFTTVQEERVTPLLGPLSRLHRTRRDVLVLALSPEGRDRVEPFVKRHAIPFAVGAGTRSYRDRRLEFKSWPQIVVIRNVRDEQESRVERFETVDALEGEFPADQGAPPAMESGAFDAESPEDLLRDHVYRDPEQRERIRALTLLRAKMPPAEFMSFCDEVLNLDQGEDASIITWWGEVGYQRYLADPSIPENQPLRAPSVTAFREYHRSSDKRNWAEFESFSRTAESLTAEQLSTEYVQHLTDKPNDLLIRREAVSQLTKVGKVEDFDRARKTLMDIFDLETDPVIRQRIVGGLCAICQPGDSEVVAFLEERLPAEQDIRWVRPTIRYTIRFLTTGEE